MQSEESHRLKIQNDFAQLSQVRAQVKNFFSKNLTSKDLMQVIQSVDEAVANVIEHGYPDGRNGNIEIELLKFNDHIAIVITDDAGHFDPAALPAVNPEERYEQGLDGGIGVYIYSTFMHATREPLAGQGNRLKLVKRIE